MISQGRHVVDERRAFADRHFGHLRLRRINRDRDSQRPRQAGNHRPDARVFFLGADQVRPWTRGLAADIDDVSAERGHLDGRGFGSARIEIQTAIGKGIWGDVQDAHDERAGTKMEDSTVRESEREVRSRGHCKG